MNNNNTYKIKIESPLLRPGITIETECSERYVATVTNKLMEIVRVINGADNLQKVKEEVVDEKAKEILDNLKNHGTTRINPIRTTTDQDRPLDLRSHGTNPYVAKGPSDIKVTYANGLTEEPVKTAKIIHEFDELYPTVSVDEEPRSERPHYTHSFDMREDADEADERPTTTRGLTDKFLEDLPF